MDPAYVFDGTDGKRTLAEPFEARSQLTGWRFAWYSSGEPTFNFDFGVSFTPAEIAGGETLYNFGTIKAGGSERQGVSIFFKDEAGRVFRTYATFARGIDLLNTAYNCLDLVPKGRDEGDRPQHWVKRHDQYGG